MKSYPWNRDLPKIDNAIKTNFSASKKPTIDVKSRNLTIKCVKNNFIINGKMYLETGLAIVCSESLSNNLKS